ncbi:MAG: alanine racemase, partial [Pseudomonadota bacterium]
MKRRTFFIGGSALIAAGAGAMLLRPAEEGAMHSDYFRNLAGALGRAGLNRPTLVIDRQRLVANIAAIRQSVDKAGLPLRVVAKSLPSPKLLDAVLAGMGSDRLMVFSAEMLLQLLPARPQADYLMGKPLPASEYARVIDTAGGDAVGNVQWLIDTPLRLSEYVAVAKARGVPLNASLEIDVGLHR